MKLTRMRIVRIAVSILIIFFVGELAANNAFGAIENYYEDILYQRGYAVPDDIKIIGIDQATLEELGPFSNWKRSTFADLINILYSAENPPTVVGLDVIFVGRTSDEEDDALVRAVDGRSVVIASKLNITTRSDYITHSYDYYVASEEASFEKLRNVSGRGFTNAIIDKDGYLRKAYISLTSDGITYDSFAARILQSSGTPTATIPSVIEFEYTGNPGDFEVVSMSDVLSGAVPAEHFSDSIVLIGAYEDGMMDSYSVPISHGNPMFGVEVTANTINAVRSDRILSEIPIWFKALLFIGFLGLFTFLAYHKSIGKSGLYLGIFLGLYAAFGFAMYHLFYVKSTLLYIPLGLVLLFLAAMIIRYVESMMRQAEEMKQTLFSMADSMAEAIEGRTPYNANHTKNVAKRSVEMLRYINKKHKEGKCAYHFSANDIDQMYLAAMLHDIGKMDVPLEIMDKPTKLGNKEERLKMRLEIIRLHIENDLLSGKIKNSEAEKKLKLIDAFLEKLELYNCGKPLTDEEKKAIEKFSRMTYVCSEDDVLSYLTDEEFEDLSIRAGTLSDSERTVMQSHVVYTNKILSHVHFGESFDKVTAMASNHHELMNGKGYPNGIGAEQLDVMTRILTIMDIYDSLIADDRPYKKPKSPEEAFRILDEEAEAGKLDKELVEIAKEMYLKEEG